MKGRLVGKMMGVFVVITATLLAATTELQGQLLGDDQDFRPQVRRDEVANKTCPTYDYFTYTGLDDVTMVDRTKFYLTVTGRAPKEMQCPFGTLLSMSASVCECDVIIPRIDVIPGRCIRLNGDIQTSNQLNGTQRTDEAPDPFKRVSIQVVLFDATDFIASGGCSENPITVVLFNGNSPALSSVDIKLEFRISSSSPAGIYRIATNAPCTNDSSNPSFDVTYAKAVGNAQLLVTLQLTNGSAVSGGSGERLLQIACDVVDIFRGPGLSPYVFTESAAGNYVRISGVLSSPNTISVTLANSQIEGAVDAPASGFCSVTHQIIPPTIGVPYIIAPRNCPLKLGQAPNDVVMCMLKVDIEKDC